MATRGDFAEKYSKLIISSIQDDGFGRTKALNESAIYKSATSESLKYIAEDINNLVDGNENPLSLEAKQFILELVAKSLQLSDTALLERVVRSARNDDFSELVDLVSSIIG